MIVPLALLLVLGSSAAWSARSKAAELDESDSLAAVVSSAAETASSSLETPMLDVATSTLPASSIAVPTSDAAPARPTLATQTPAQIRQQLDRDTCGQSPCRFLIVQHTMEQESKASLHIGQIATLAHKTNRTLVLPRVSGGRYGLCSLQYVEPLAALTRCSPFEVYHDVPALEQLFDVRAISWETFLGYSKARSALDAELDAVLFEARRGYAAVRVTPQTALTPTATRSNAAQAAD